MENYIIVNGEKAYRFRLNENYFITKTGILYSIYKKGGNGSTDINNPHKVAYGQDRDGYYRVILSMNGHRKYIKVHQIVALQFIGDIPEGMVVNHKDGIKHNNNVKNLEIVTALENIKHSWRTGLSDKEQNPHRIHIDVLDNETGIVDHLTSLEDVKRKYHMSWQYINNVKTNKINYAFCHFKKITTGDGQTDYYLEVYNNGKLYKTFKSNQEAGDFFGKKCNTISHRLKNEKTKYLNRYTLTFPNLSTIENIAS